VVMMGGALGAGQHHRRRRVQYLCRSPRRQGGGRCRPAPDHGWAGRDPSGGDHPPAAGGARTVGHSRGSGRRRSAAPLRPDRCRSSTA
jgi:hypothetical protein